MPRNDFYDFDEVAQSIILSARENPGKFVGRTAGFSGAIFRFDRGGSLSQTCAKVPLRNDRDSKIVAERFVREFGIQCELYYHEFVHWPFDFDFVMGAPVAWFRMWHGDLSDLIEREEFGLPARLSMLSYIAAGMIHCHSRGLIAHQDFKPENIFVRDLRRDFAEFPECDVFRVPKIADFGSANLASEKGIFRGTRPYMAPEQWRKEPLGEHTTVWSLGALAYELMSYGDHPIGLPTRPWRNRETPVWNEWQNDTMWRRWIEAGGAPARPLLDTATDKFVRSCMHSDQLKRPSLGEVRDQLLGLLEINSAAAATQARFRISNAASDAKKSPKWVQLGENYRRLAAKVSGMQRIKLDSAK